MKIFFDHQIFAMQQFGGISRYFNELTKIEHDNIGIIKLDPSLLKDPEAEKKSRKVRTDLYSRGINYVKRRVLPPKKPVADKGALKLRYLISQSEFDIFHPTYYDPYFLEYVKKPYVLTVYDMIHEIFQEYFSISDPTSRNKRLLCENAAAIIAISENTKKDLVEIFNIPESKVHATQLASDFNKVLPATPLNGEGLQNFILFTGTRWGYKNFYFCVTALSEILKKDPALKLLCTGHPFDIQEQEFFRDLGIQNQVVHIYLKDDRELAWAYQRASLFVFPSLYEGFGFPVLEAYASGCPVISSGAGSLKEVGGDGSLYFNPKNLLEIRTAAQQALYDKDVREKMIRKGKLMFEKFSWDKCRMETMEVYKSVLNHG